MIAVQLFALVLAADQSAAGPIATNPASPPPISALAAPAPVAPAVAAPPAPPSEPRHIDDLDKPLTGAVPQGSYEVGVKGAFARAENLQGPLDGTWVLSETGGAKIYRLQLDDPGYRGGPIEGAFQDLNANAAPGGSGFIDAIVRDGVSLTMNFNVRGALASLALEVKPGGTYAGKMTRAGISRDVTLARP